MPGGTRGWRAAFPVAAMRPPPPRMRDWPISGGSGGLPHHFDRPVHGGRVVRAEVVDDAGRRRLDLEAGAFSEILRGELQGPSFARDVVFDRVVVGPADRAAHLDPEGVG